jgi:hypothetical protein
MWERETLHGVAPLAGAGQPVPQERLPQIGMDGMAASAFLSALHVHEAESIARAELVGENGLTMTTIRVPRRLLNAWDPRKPPVGLEVLLNELARTPMFDVLSREGRIIALFPHVDPTDPLVVRSQRGELTYVNLSDFQGHIPSLVGPDDEEGRRNAALVWRTIAQTAAADRRAIQHYRQSRPATQAMVELRTYFSTPGSAKEQRAYVYAEVDKRTGARRLVQFNPADILSVSEFPGLWPVKPETWQVIFAVLPSVYSPASQSHRNSDAVFMDTLVQVMHEFPFQAGDRVMVPFSGSGWDTILTAWILHQRGLADTVPVRALEWNAAGVADTVDTARRAGVSVAVQQHDNIISAAGTPAFPGEEFALIFGNMPAYRPPAADIPPRVRREKAMPVKACKRWDGDVDGRIFRRFLRGLPYVLRPGGMAVIWNLPTTKQIRQIIEEEGLDLTVELLADDYAIDGDAYYVHAIKRPSALPSTPEG